MVGPGWSDDDPGDQGRIVANCRRVLAHIRTDARARRTPTADENKEWHAAIYRLL
ncbi:MAG: hypothetical protein ACYDB7_10035 [Mycobacteriales bacterium]